MSTPFEAVAEIANACQPLPHLITGGQPSAEQLTRFRQAGGAVVLDIRDPMEPRGLDEPAVAKAAGLSYINIPVSGGTLSTATMERILQVLREHSGQDVLFHCASGNRVGGALIPYLVLDHGLEQQDAVDQAMRIGLRSAELMEWGLDYLQQRSD